jgi:hypothetical protein
MLGRELRRIERERTNLLFSIAAGMAAFVYHEMGRRQGLGETREEARRTYVDNELGELRRGVDGAKARAEGAQEAATQRTEREQRRISWLNLAVAFVGVLVVVLAYKLI